MSASGRRTTGQQSTGNLGRFTMTTATSGTDRQQDDGLSGQAPAQPRRAGRPGDQRRLGFPEQKNTTQWSRARRTLDSRRAAACRKAGDLDGALAIFAGLDTAKAETKEARWAFTEWKQVVKRRFGDRPAQRSTAREREGPQPWLPHGDDGALEVAAVMGMRWLPGKVVSRRSLRGLRPLTRRRVMVVRPTSTSPR